MITRYYRQDYWTKCLIYYVSYQQTMNRVQWATCIGHIIISMNEIDWLTHACKQKVFGEELSNQWREKALAKRLKTLHQRINENDSSPWYPALKILLAEAQELCVFRNKIAHGSFVINCDRPMTEDPDSQLEILTLGHEQTITEEDLKNKALRCREISQEISKQIAIAEMAKMEKKDV